MIQVVATITIVGFATLTAISGIFILADSWSTEYSIEETNDSRQERNLESESDEDISSNSNSINDGGDQDLNKKSHSSKTQLNHNLAITNGLDAVKIYAYSNQVTILYNTYAQSKLLSSINGIRAPTLLS